MRAFLSEVEKIVGDDPAAGWMPRPETDEGPLIERLLQALDDAAAALDFLADVQPDEGMRATIRQKAQDARDAMRKVQIAREI